jgi:hypothetical protein
MRNTRAELVLLGTRFLHRRPCRHNNTSQVIQWAVSTTQHTCRRMGHYQVVVVTDTTPSSNSTFPEVTRTGVPQLRPAGRAPATIRNDSVVA